MLVLAALVLASGFVLRVAWEELAHPKTPALAQTNTQQVRVTRVVNGDTIEVSPRAEGKTDVRLIGVDTPRSSGEKNRAAPRPPLSPGSSWKAGK